VIVGGSYTFLGAAALGLLLGAAIAEQGSDTLARDWTATFLDMPCGVGFVVTTGGVVIVVALLQFLTAVTAEFAQRLALERSFCVTRVLVRSRCMCPRS
jgi:hypothetical protein